MILRFSNLIQYMVVLQLWRVTTIVWCFQILVNKLLYFGRQNCSKFKFVITLEERYNSLNHLYFRLRNFDLTLVCKFYSYRKSLIRQLKVLLG